MMLKGFVILIRNLATMIVGVCDLMLVVLEPKQEQPPAAPPVPCQHPQDYRVDTTVMGGGKQFLCTKCQQLVLMEDSATKEDTNG